MKIEKLDKKILVQDLFLLKAIKLTHIEISPYHITS